MMNGTPVWNVAIAVTVQPPAMASTTPCASEPNWRPRPNGRSQIALVTSRCRVSNDVKSLSSARKFVICAFVAPPASQPSVKPFAQVYSVRRFNPAELRCWYFAVNAL